MLTKMLTLEREWGGKIWNPYLRMKCNDAQESFSLIEGRLLIRRIYVSWYSMSRAARTSNTCYWEISSLHTLNNRRLMRPFWSHSLRMHGVHKYQHLDTWLKLGQKPKKAETCLALKSTLRKMHWGIFTSNECVIWLWSGHRSAGNWKLNWSIEYKFTFCC